MKQKYQEEKQRSKDCREQGWHEKDRCYRDCTRDDRLRKRKRELDKLNDDKTRTYSPWLLIRYDEHDIGLRPIPSGAVHWRSPDIWVESSDPQGDAVAGEENFVHARVFNLGKAISIPTRVDFYWADPSIGLGAQHMNLIGTEWVDVDPHTASDVRCKTPWVPVFVNNGHECLMVNCTNMMLDKINFPFQPKIDRHVGQRNITVIRSTKDDELPFMVMVNNLLMLPVQVEIMANVEHIRADPKMMKQLAPHTLYSKLAAFAQRPQLTTTEMRHRFARHADDYYRANRMARYLGQNHDKTLNFDLGLERLEPHHRGTTRIDAIWGKGGRKVAPVGDKHGALASFQADNQLADSATGGGGCNGFKLTTAEFDGFEQRALQVDISAPPTLKWGQFVVVTLEARVAGAVIGGYTIIAAGK